MPFIDSKITLKLTEDKKEQIKNRLGQAVSLMNKKESSLMVGLDDDYALYYGGNKLEKGAYVSVSVFSKATAEAYGKMTAEICAILSEELGIPGNAVYVTYHEVSYWGWNGANF
jgi:phenylpyruvate tautomerase PptA (4-oxalocrotonate tautomerase family)